MDFGFFKRSKVTVTSVNIKWTGAVHQLAIPKVRGKEFDVKIAFQNKPQNDYNIDILKTQKRPPLSVTKIEVREPFKLISVTPTPPLEVAEGEKIEFKVRVAIPEMNYEGPLNIDIGSDNSAMVHIELSKILLSMGSKTMDITKSPVIMDVLKGQIFKQNIHLLGVVDIGAQVNAIGIAPPFSFVSSDPKLPFKIDRKTGFLIDVLIQAPQQSYGGPLEIRLS